MSQTFTIPGPAGQLEAIYHEARGLAAGLPPRATAIVCHPHPVHGGNMHSTVCFKIARGLQAEGVACLRINFRGVGESAGVHDGNGAEEEDARAALNWLAERHPHVECWAAGFSFGSRTVFGLALKEPTIRRLLLVGFPARVYPLDGVDQLTIPTLFIWGDRDEFGTRVDLLQQYPNLPATHALQEIEGADHFFRRFTKELESQVREYAQAALAPDALG